MDFTFLESILYGLTMGVTEFLPVSSQAHSAILLKLFGSYTEGHLLRLMVHMGAFVGLIAACWSQIHHIRRELRLAAIPKRRRKRQPDQKTMLDLKIVKTALFPAVLGFFIYFRISSWESDLSKAALFLVLNGIFIFLPRIMSSGNKDSRAMTGLDSLFMGICAAVSLIPGISRVGFITTAAQIRGADRQQAYYWSLLLSIPLMIGIMIMDIYGMISLGAAAIGFGSFWICLVSAGCACFGAYLAISAMRFLAVNAGYASFAYYSWGAALFAFIFYLTI